MADAKRSSIARPTVSSCALLTRVPGCSRCMGDVLRCAAADAAAAAAWTEYRFMLPLITIAMASLL